ECLLHGILSSGLRQEAPAVAEHRPAIALDDGLKRPFLPSLRECQQPSVGLRAQNRGGERRCHSTLLMPARPDKRFRCLSCSDAECVPILQTTAPPKHHATSRTRGLAPRSRYPSHRSVVER